MMRMEHYLTYQHNVQRAFREHSDKYDGVIIPLSIATAFPSGTYGFIRALCSHDRDVQYAIDPRNALFQKAWDRNSVRPPHEKMARVFGEPYTGRGLMQALIPDDFADCLTFDQHVERCIAFQKGFRTRSEDKRKLEKYRKLLGLASLKTLKEPQHLIPPYYEFFERGDPWYELSMRAIEASLAYRDGIPIRPVLHFSRWAEHGDWTSCLSRLAAAGIKEFWYYPNNFREHDASAAELVAYREAIHIAVRQGLQPFTLFGGYCAVLMSYFGLGGFGNGIGYGEWRDSGYHRGGTAMTRVYLLKLHRYVDAPTAQSLIERDPDYFGSDSEIVAGYVVSGQSVVDMTLQEAQDHFMECRRQELEFVRCHPIEDAVSELAETSSRLQENHPLEADKFGVSLQRWQDALMPGAG